MSLVSYFLSLPGLEKNMLPVTNEESKLSKKENSICTGICTAHTKKLRMAGLWHRQPFEGLEFEPGLRHSTTGKLLTLQ